MLKLIAALTEKGLTLSTCESFTGGLFASKITAVSGASFVYLGSIVAYSPFSKIDIVHVEPQVIERYGTISPQAVCEMAEKTRALFKSDVAVAFSGNAGPLAQENKPVGLWYGAVASSQETLVFGGIANLKRNELREAACSEGVKNLLELIRKI
jgi:nicotinamide-nucleotide amidase